ncbi:MAG: phage holin family protein [Negativicutes bacterium]|nr:phage holin family protein [Negativicutes bacterium]
MKKFILKCLTNMVCLYIASLLFPSIAVASVEGIFWAGLLLGLINLFVRPLILLVALPINLVTLGLFTLVINAWLVMLAAHLSGGLSIPSFLLALAAAFIIAAGNIIADRLF